MGQAIDKIPTEWFDNKTSCDIHIYTDGEICDNPTNSILKLFTNNNARLFITTVEPNGRDYLKDNCNAGNRIYEIIRDNGLTNKVKQFSSYNLHHSKTPFISLSNPDVEQGYAPFRDKCFKILEIGKFIKHVDGLIKKIIEDDDTFVDDNISENSSNCSDNDSNDDVFVNKSKSENVNYLQNDVNNKLLKLVHELSLTISYLIKGKSLQIQRRTVDIFCDLFTETSIYKTIRELLLNELNNHAHGKATTFQDYKRNREKVFENAQLSLYDNVKQSISLLNNKKYVSLIMNSNTKNDVIIKTSPDTMKEKIILSDKTYNFAGCRVGNYNVPLLPINVELDHDCFDQCVRQWIRANYSKKYNVNAASDMILYYFLADAMRIFLSGCSAETKLAYKNLTYLMLDRIRYGTTLQEYRYLLDNPPAPVTGSEDKISFYLTKSMEHINLKDVSPFTFWYAFILSFDDKQLIKSQLPYCKDDIKKDKFTVDNLLDKIKLKLNHKQIMEIDCVGVVYDYDYTCYLTLDDTSETGGYLIPSHKITNKITCNPNIVISKDGLDMLKKNKNSQCCPVCYTKLNIKDFCQISSRIELEAEHQKMNNNVMPTLNEPFYDIKNYEVVNISNDEFKGELDTKIFKMNTFNFDTISYSINCPHIQEPLGTRFIEVKTQEEFNKSVFSRYHFLENINFNNVCLAGGFCRSILLKQRLKDFDFFIYGDNHEATFYRLLNEIMTFVKNDQKNIKFLIMYKHLFNVYEIVCIHDPNNFFKEGYCLDNFKTYDFKSLHQFDKVTVIDPKTGKVYKKKGKTLIEIVKNMLSIGKKESLANIIEKGLNEQQLAMKAEDFLMKVNVDEDNDPTKVKIESEDFSNYFEDGDVNGVKMFYRFQFILSKFKSIEDILSNFDFHPCRVAFDGKITWFTKSSAKAYKYMINVIDERSYSDTFNYRLSKYFTYGFSVVLPELNMKALNNTKVLNIGNTKFTISRTNDKCIMVEHNSHVLEQLNSLQQLEKKSLKKDGKALYKSSLFCSLVSLLRYVKINNVSYLVTKKVTLPKANGEMKFQELTEKVYFIDRINGRIPDSDLYGAFRIGYAGKKPTYQYELNGKIFGLCSNSNNSNNSDVESESDYSDVKSESDYSSEEEDVKPQKNINKSTQLKKQKCR